jgi:hypothetical protein
VNSSSGLFQDFTPVSGPDHDPMTNEGRPPLGEITTVSVPYQSGTVSGYAFSPPTTINIGVPVKSYKYDEVKLLQELAEYVANTYGQHYVGSDNVQSLDLIFSNGNGKGFCAGNVTKYVNRYGKKGGHNRDDLMKTLHYALLLLYDHDKQGR